MRRALRHAGLALLLGLLAVAAAPYLALRASLPRIDGAADVPVLAAPATIERDALGVPTIRAASRHDLAYATGVAHAQDRFFQMDLARRAAAGELAALLGPGLIEVDKRLRRHGFSQVAAEVVQRADEDDKAILEAYAAGVNAVLDGALAARARPWEYLLLNLRPRAWRPEDSVLVGLSMYLDLHDSSGEAELAHALLREVLPAELYAWLHPLGTEWDAPLEGGVFRPAPIPGPEVLDLRRGEARALALRAPPMPATDLEGPAMAGSNAWAVAGSHTADGGALLANDMHLSLRVPHVWYRARLVTADGETVERDLVGVTLPGLPMLIVGSNGHVAWGFTNSYGDWADLVRVETDPRDAGRYLTAEGSEAFGVRREVIEVRGGAPVTHEVRTTRWGPVVHEPPAGPVFALAWTAHHPAAINTRLIDFESVRTVDELLAVAPHVGAPVQSVVAADAGGRIGWTLMGRVPLRSAYDATVPQSWRTAGTGWLGWREPQAYPRLLDPASGRLWSANGRMTEAAKWMEFLGDGGYDLGARGAQIRDALLALTSATAEDMKALQLDDRALFLARWRDVLLELPVERAAADEAVRGRRALARKLVESWSGRAAVEDPGYTIVREFRRQVLRKIYGSLTAAARVRYPQAVFTPSRQFEGPLWQLVMHRPPHLLDPRHANWDEALLAALDAAIDELAARHPDGLEASVWGAHNTLRMRHPLSESLGLAGRWLDMPPVPLPGDRHMPRVQGPTFGASQRLVVSPGREAQGMFQMPGGQSGHPLSPFYRAGHDAWVRGEPLPLLPGEARHTLRLQPTAP
ncbi:MAG: penicillin acylase family protein [Proteobacteria bacterium]|nr:MAG: penicillin acylase family protein [Pseudomonadota bacterium]